MAKRVGLRPEGFPAPQVREICSVSTCMARDFADWARHWLHNGYWMFDTPDRIREVARREGLDLAGVRFFFYEAYEREFDEDGLRWIPLHVERSTPTQVALPAVKTPLGFDVVTYSCRTAAECSPLSCNLLAATMETNEHCLLSTLERAIEGLEAGRFANSEPGPFRILAVHEVARAGDA